MWCRMVDDLFKSLDIDKSEWLEDIKHGDSSSASFMASLEECVSERESREFEEGLNTKVKLYTVEPLLTDALNNGHLLLSGQRRCTDHHCH